MIKFVDLTEKTFGELTVLKMSHIKRQIRYWTCKCSCGNTKTINGRDLRCGDTKSCGCKTQEWRNEKRVIDLTNKKIGYWTCLYRRGSSWLCRCDCGIEKEVNSSQLRNGDSKSCGCGISGHRNKAKLPGLASAHILMCRYITGANKRKLAFNIDEKTFIEITQSKCHYCGANPSQIAKYSSTPYIYNGVDRIDNNRGYEPDNIVSCCGICNSFKTDYPVDLFIKHCQKIVEHLS